MQLGLQAFLLPLRISRLSAQIIDAGCILLQFFVHRVLLDTTRLLTSLHLAYIRIQLVNQC